MNTLAGLPSSGRLLLLAAVSLCFLATSGCRSLECLEMSVENGVMHRAEVECSEEDAPVHSEVLKPGKIPDGLGEYGWFLHENTAMGSLNLYIEQFDRFTDPSASLDMRRFAVQRLVDVWIAWLDSEFSGEPGYALFRDFVDGEIRGDVDDLFLVLWGYGAFGPSLTKFDDEDDGTLFGEAAVRGLTYLALRGYFELDEARDVIAAFGSDNKYDNHEPIVDFWARAVARRMGRAEDAPLPFPLSAVHAHPHRYAGSYAFFVDESLAIRDLVSEWQSEYPDYVDAQVPDPVETIAEPPADPEPAPSPVPGEIEEIVISTRDLDPVRTPAKIDFYDGGNFWRADNTLIEYAFGGELVSVGGTTGLTAVLRIPEEPLWSNAHETDGNRLVWGETIGGMTFYANEMSTVLYAAWVEPNGRYQREKFGEIVLEGEDLAGYVLWQMQLRPHHAEEWQEFIDSLTPGKENEQSLKLYHFSDEPDSSVEIIQEFNDEQEVIGEHVRNQSVAHRGANAIIRSLRAADDQGDE
jgi:hypothetical protein